MFLLESVMLSISLRVGNSVSRVMWYLMWKKLPNVSSVAWLLNTALYSYRHIALDKLPFFIWLEKKMKNSIFRRFICDLFLLLTPFYFLIVVLVINGYWKNWPSDGWAVTKSKSEGLILELSFPRQRFARICFFRFWFVHCCEGISFAFSLRLARNK